MLFAVIRHDKPNSFDLRMSARPKHLEYLNAVLEKVTYGGPLLGPDGKQNGSILIIDVVDQEAAQAFADADPFVESGLFAATVVQPFGHLFQDGARR